MVKENIEAGGNSYMPYEDTSPTWMERLSAYGKKFEPYLNSAAQGVKRFGNNLYDAGDKGLNNLRNDSDSQLLASGINDYFQRNIKGKLAATDAAVSPFTNYRTSKAFTDGVGGFDLPEKFAQAKLQKDSKVERDRNYKILWDILNRSNAPLQKLDTISSSTIDENLARLKSKVGK